MYSHYYFNPRSHKGSDFLTSCIKKVSPKFQSTLPQGERPPPGSGQVSPWWISIHAPTRGATISFLISCSSFLISIHAPTRGATTLSNTGYITYMISIHAPTRGATMSKRFLPGSTGISIHAPTRGATPCRKPSRLYSIFQSTLPQGERLGNAGSWHIDNLNFNPRSHKGSDGILAVFIDMDMVFQSTLPQGERLKGAGFESSYYIFQSTLPQGERQLWP